MKRLIDKYDGTIIQDDGPCKSIEFKQFAKDLKKELKQIDEFRLVDVTVGHYYVSGFLEKEGKYVYFSFDVPRGNQVMDMSKTDAFNGVLIRTAKNPKDYKGGHNNFTNFYRFVEDVNNLF